MRSTKTVTLVRMVINPMSQDRVRFSAGDIAWAIIAAASMLVFSYTMLYWFGVDNLPWEAVPSDRALIVMRFSSLLAFVLCVAFYPSKHD